MYSWTEAKIFNPLQAVLSIWRISDFGKSAGFCRIRHIPPARNYHSVENACSNKNVFSLRLKMLRVCYFLNCMGQAVPSFGPNMEKNSICQTSAELSVVHNGEFWQIWDGFWLHVKQNYFENIISATERSLQKYFSETGHVGKYSQTESISATHSILPTHMPQLHYEAVGALLIMMKQQTCRAHRLHLWQWIHHNMPHSCQYQFILKYSFAPRNQLIILTE